MDSTINGKTLEIDLDQLLGTIQAEDVPDLIDSLAITDAVIEAVGQQITEGWTALGSHSDRDCTARSAPLGALDRVIREIAKAHGDIVQGEIEKMEKALVANEEDNTALRVMLRESYDRSVVNLSAH